ncbi:MAG: ribosome maturation factor RimP [Pseudomonadota bacterium]
MELQALIEPTLVGMGYELVALERVGRGLLRVYIDSPNGIGVEDCAKVSNQLTRVFMVENIDYSRLEVSSPGLDRPLVKRADFERFAGEMATIKLRLPTEAGRKKFVGRLLGLVDDVLNLETESGPVAIALADIDSARLVPNI